MVNITNADYIRLYSTGRALPAIPYYTTLVGIIRERNLGKHQYTLADYAQMIKPLVAKLKAAKVKGANINAFTLHMKEAHRWYKRIKLEREVRTHREPALSLDQRIVDYLYMPYIQKIEFALLSNDKNSKIRMHRGEPDVKRRDIQHGYGWGGWNEIIIDVTVQKGWSYLAKQDRIVVAHQSQNYQLVLGFTQDMIDKVEHETYDVGRVAIVRRGVGTKTLVPNVPVAWHGRFSATGKTPALAVKALTANILTSVKSRLG